MATRMIQAPTPTTGEVPAPAPAERNRLKRGYDMGLRSALYAMARLMGDANAVKKGRVGKRIARRSAGKATGRTLRKLIK